MSRTAVSSRPSVKQNAFPAGLLILLSLVILVGGILWLRDFSLRPAYTFDVTYKHPTRLISGYPIYYRGVQVGRVAQVALAPDLSATNVTMGISKKEIHIPTAVRIYTREEPISGQHYIDIVPPDGPLLSSSYIHDGDTLNGVEPLNWDKFQEQLSRIAENRGFEKLVNSTQEAMAGLKGASQELQGFGMDARHFLINTEGPTHQALFQFTEASRQVASVAGDVRGLTGSMKGQMSNAFPKMVAAFQQLGENTRNAPQALDAVSRAANRADETLANLNSQLVQSNLLPNLSHTITGINHMMGTGSNVHQYSPDQVNAFGDQLTAFEGAASQLRDVLASKQSPPQSGSEIVTDLEQLRAFADATAQKAQVTRQQLTQAIQTKQPQSIEMQMDEMKSLADESVLLVQRIQTRLSTAQVAAKLGTANLSPAVMSEIQKFGSTARMLSSGIQQWQATAPIETVGSQQSVFGGIGSLFKNLNRATARIDCTTSQASHIMGQRFLGMKLLFGKPGGGYSCDDADFNPANPQGKPEADTPKP